MKSNKWQQWLFVSALLIPFASCSYTQSSNKSVQNPVKVTVYTVFEEKESPERMYVGVVEEANKVLLSFPAPGKVKQVYVSVGQTVNQGQILATLDSETLEQMHASALATLRQAEDAWED